MAADQSFFLRVCHAKLFFYLKGRLYLVCISAVSRPDPEKRIHMTFVGHVGELERASEQTNQAIFCCCVLIAIGFVASVWFAIVRTRPRTTARDWLRSGKRAICLVSIFNPTSSGLLFFYFKAPPFECLHECFFLKEVKKRRDRLCQTRQSLLRWKQQKEGNRFFLWFASMERRHVLACSFSLLFWTVGRTCGAAGGKREVGSSSSNNNNTNVECGMIMVAWD